MDFRITTPPWEFERHRRGLIRWLDIGELLNMANPFATGSVTLGPPWARFLTQNVTAAGTSKGMEKSEQPTPGSLIIGAGYDTFTWFGRNHFASVFHEPDTNIISAGFAVAFIALIDPGILYAAGALQPAWGGAGAPLRPVCTLAWESQGNTGPTQWALYTCDGLGSAVTKTILAGVDGPSDGTNLQKLQRMELFYVPGQYAAASIDGIEGARVTTNLPDPNYIPLAARRNFSIGCFTSSGLGDVSAHMFGGIRIESPLR